MSPSPTNMPHLILLRQQRAQEPQRTKQQQQTKSRSTAHLARHIIPISVETGGPWNPESVAFIAELGKRISKITLEPLETQFFSKGCPYRWLQRGNELALRNTFLAELFLCQGVCNSRQHLIYNFSLQASCWRA